MEWLVLGRKTVELAGDAEQLTLLLKQLDAMAQTGDGDDRTLLTELKAGRVGEWVDANKEELLRRLAELFLDGEQVDQLARMRSRVGKLADSQSGPVTVLWPKADSGSTATSGGFQLEVALEGGAAFVVNPEGVNNDRPETTPTRLRFRGKARVGAEGATRSGDGSRLAASGGADLLRRIDYELAYPDELKTIHALGDAVSRLARLDDRRAVRNGFRGAVEDPDGRAPSKPPLRTIRYRGQGGLEFSVGATITVPGIQYGALDTEFSARAKMGDRFALKISPAEGDALHVEGSLDELERSDRELKLDYRLGVSTLPAATVRELLGAAAGVGDLIGTVDAHLETAQSLLKPGTLLRDRLEHSLKDRLDNGDASLQQAVRNALAEALGVEADDATLIGEVTDWIAGELDDATGRPLSDDGRKVIRDTLAGYLPEEAEQSVANLIDGVASDLAEDLENRLQGAEDALNGKTRRAIESVLDAPESTKGRSGTEALNNLRSFLDDARQLVRKIINGLRDPQRDLIAAELAWRRQRLGKRAAIFEFEIDGNGDEFYRRLIQAPTRFATQPVDRSIPGVRLASPRTNVRTSKSVLRDIGSWNVGVLDVLDLAGQKKVVSRVRVEATPVGVTVGSGGAIEREREALFSDAKRQVIFRDTLGLVPDSGGDLSLSGHISLQLNQDEPGWDKGGGEAEHFVRAFHRAHLASERAVERFIAWRDEAAGPDRTPPDAVARVRLTIGPGNCGRVIRYASDNPDSTKKIALAALYHAGVELTRENADHEAYNFRNAFELMQQAREHFQRFQDRNGPRDHAAFRDNVLELQAEARDRLDQLWTRTGYAGVTAPDSGVLAFFLGLQTLAREAIGERPPLVFSFRGEEGDQPRMMDAAPQDPIELALPYGAFDPGGRVS